MHRIGHRSRAPDLSRDELMRILRYDPETGVFTWRGTGKKAGWDCNGYCRIQIRGGQFLAHRLAWFYVHGVWPDRYIDHANGNPGDNRISNIREATPTQNRLNSKRQSNNTSGFKGVSWNDNAGLWHCRAIVDGKRIHIGYFADPSKAHEAYLAAAVSSNPQFVRPE